MQADFLDAHERHWYDADRLFSAGRYANADHLFGMAAECGLKRLMMKFGMMVSTEGKPKERDDREHVDKIWARFESYRSGSVEGRDYGLPTPNPFDNGMPPTATRTNPTLARRVCNFTKPAQWPSVNS